MKRVRWPQPYQSHRMPNPRISSKKRRMGRQRWTQNILSRRKIKESSTPLNSQVMLCTTQSFIRMVVEPFTGKWLKVSVSQVSECCPCQRIFNVSNVGVKKAKKEEDVTEEDADQTTDKATQPLEQGDEGGDDEEESENGAEGEKFEDTEEEDEPKLPSGLTGIPCSMI